ncbi:hypothetical protein EJB05_52789 [Eragrostis curvula]|uniref:Uncharacterized protein n=1 Tax=Eragrostis curvula TaxID=38414 RepID=A0A5J9SS09_9POAL|nr:hypothetical protein EJB05_52789 [Eragrostis curvula]
MVHCPNLSLWHLRLWPVWLLKQLGQGPLNEGVGLIGSIVKYPIEQLLSHETRNSICRFVINGYCGDVDIYGAGYGDGTFTKAEKRDSG